MALGVAHDDYTGRRGRCDHLAAANKRITLFAQIETATGVENADAIAAVDGVDCLWVGHFDLTCSLGIPGQFDHPKFQGCDRRALSRPAESTTRRSAASCRMSRPASTMLTRASTSSAIPVTSGCCGPRTAMASTRCGRASTAAPLSRRRRRAGSTWRMDPFRVALSRRLPQGRRHADLSHASISLRSPTHPTSRYAGSTPWMASCRLSGLDGFRRADPARASASRAEHPAEDRLAVVARFGVGYDNVDVAGLHRGRHRRSSSRRTACAGRSRCRC